ncbi:MAG: hypothetical protein HY078_06255 [Elusimicrobia bacterium]|nr:hypothetical protein [Elusimicrobiota bacterium]
MRVLHAISLAIGLTLFCLPCAKADVSDPGNLTIGGQAIIQSTLTVQGQDSSGYSLKVSSSIQALCINLQGGQLCGPGGSGNSVLSATQTFTGSNTFDNVGSTTTFNGFVNFTAAYSTQSFIAQGTTQNNTVTVCVATATWTAHSNTLSFGLVGAFSNGTLNTINRINYFVNGAFQFPYSNSNAANICQVYTGGYTCNATSGPYWLTTTPGTKYNICFGAFEISGTTLKWGDNSFGTGKNQPFIWIKEGR